ncbi:ElyC/SanA/YdcF family protein [Photobacterium sp.]|uniref:ElyC/SanA/YdcF family protein n=1 Tax=Photobacterium sp. TaxID=660 RepID=UPI00299DDEDC|nr:ElyC/SanA/YdcF family protein [Photobacterium sp.]MDX1301516.1 ElyC/SanA/YdcF family protein [Photobacterium sp.]
MIQLLHNALTAFNYPNRDCYPQQGRDVSNLEAVEYYLTQAIALAPKRQDLQITLANMQTFRGNIELALHSYQQALSSATSTSDKKSALVYLTVWHYYQGNFPESRQYLEQLVTADKPLADKVACLLSKIEGIVSTPVHYWHGELRESEFPAEDEHFNHAIITLGFKLNDDGSIAPQLLQRLSLTVDLSKRYPHSVIIVTGGLEKAGITESQAMKAWLVDHGVSGNRVIEEDQATNTIDNARFSLALLERHHIHRATLVSASIHVHRSQVLFDTLQWRERHSTIHFTHCAVEDGLLSFTYPEGKVKRDCYIDALRCFGLPAFNCSPLIQL